MQLCVKRCDAVMVMQHKSMHKLVADCGLQLAQPSQIGVAHRGRCFDFNAHHTPLWVFNHQVHFVLVFAAKV